MGLDCQTCDDILKKERGCFNTGILPFEIDSELVFRCPLKLITDLSWEYIKAFGFYKKGMLPNSSLWTNESDRFLQAMIALENEIVKLETEKIGKIKNG